MTLYDVSPLEVYIAKPMPIGYSHRRYLRLLRLVNNIHQRYRWYDIFTDILLFNFPTFLHPLDVGILENTLQISKLCFSCMHSFAHSHTYSHRASYRETTIEIQRLIWSEFVAI